jgi:HlyD family secretion protein
MAAFFRSLKFNRRWLYLLIPVPFVIIFAASRTAAPEVLVVPVKRGLIRTEISDFGTTRFNSVYTVAAPSSGWISKTLVSLGENITEKKTALFALSAGLSPLLDARTKATLKAQAESALSTVSQSKAAVRRVKSSLSYALNDLARNESVYKAGAISLHDIETLRAQVKGLREELRAAEAALDAALHQHDAARAALGTSDSAFTELQNIYAPKSGIVSWIYDEKARLVTTGTPLLDIAQTGDLSFEIDLLAREAMSVRKGMTVRFSNFPLEGLVRTVSPTALPKISPLGISEQRTRVWIDFAGIPEGPVPAGLELEAHIEISAKPNALKVPSTSLWSVELTPCQRTL